MSVVVAAGATHVGRVRTNNEDGHLIDTDHGVFIVADGMGGHAAGEVASASAVAIVHQAWTGVSMQRRIEAFAANAEAEARRALLRAVREGVAAAHLDIVSQAKADPQKMGMGTTFTGFIVAGGEAVFGHSGDSRAYLVRDGITMQLSEDHTVTNQLRLAGIISAKATDNRWDGVLTHALGVGDTTRIATFVIRLYTGDRFLLCSDGIYEYFDDHEIGHILQEAPSPARAANELVDLAVSRGGQDNATAVVVKVVEADESIVPKHQRDADEKVLSECALLAALTPQQRLRALRITTVRELKDGKELTVNSMSARVAYLVLDGSAVSPDNDVFRPGDLVYPRALVGTSPATSAGPCVASGRTRLLTFRQDDFSELADDDLEIGVKLFEALSDIIKRSGQR